MKINRRILLVSVSALALALVGAGWFPHGGIPPGTWRSVKIGGGGFARGLDVIDSNNIVCRTDSSGAFVLDTSNPQYWRQLCMGTPPLAPKAPT